MKSNILTRWFLFLLGCAIPLPIFYDLLLKKFIIIYHQVSYLPVLAEVPVPIGFLLLVFLGLLLPLISEIKIKNDICLYKAVFLVFSFAYIIMIKIEFFRTLSLLFPYCLLFLLYCLCSSKYLLCILLRGYSFSLGTLIIIHVVSICFCYLSNQLNYTGYFYRTIFGYEIYQSFVSYSAVFSFLGSVLLISLVSANKNIKSIVFFIIIIYFVLSLGFRKAVFVDLLIVLSILLYSSFSCPQQFRKRIMKVCIFTIALMTFYAYFGLIKYGSYGLNIGLIKMNFYKSVKINERDLRLKDTVKASIEKIDNIEMSEEDLRLKDTLIASVEKIDNIEMSEEDLKSKVKNFLIFSWYNRWVVYYKFFIKIKHASTLDLIFGSNTSIDNSWGAYHNLFFNFILSMGLSGLIMFLLSFSYCIYLLWEKLKQNYNDRYRANTYVLTKIWLPFVIISFLTSNFYNVNFQLPYYIINIYFIFLSYLCFYKFPNNNGILKYNK